MSGLKEAFAFLERKMELETETALVKEKLIRGSAAFSIFQNPRGENWIKHAR